MCEAATRSSNDLLADMFGSSDDEDDDGDDINGDGLDGTKRKSKHAVYTS